MKLGMKLLIICLLAALKEDGIIKVEIQLKDHQMQTKANNHQVLHLLAKNNWQILQVKYIVIQIRIRHLQKINGKIFQTGFRTTKSYNLKGLILDLYNMQDQLLLLKAQVLIDPANNNDKIKDKDKASNSKSLNRSQYLLDLLCQMQLVNHT